jgi:PAS domain S-box-containing protein
MINMNSEIRMTIPWKLVIIFLCFSVAIILSGALFYKSQRNRIFHQNENELATIASLKVSQIEQWRRERLSDAALIKEDEPLINRIKEYFNAENQPEIKTELSNWMESVYRIYDFGGVMLIDTTFKVRLSVSPSDTVAGEPIGEELKYVMQNGKIVMTDLHRSNSVGYVHLDLLIPLIERMSKKQKPFGIMILRINPEKRLFPLIQSWPIPSKSSETLLLRKDGDSVLYLNELRFQKNTALNLRLPITNSKLLASRAVSGQKGVCEGTDYRNIPVVGYLTGIPGSKWFMVTKTDKEEIQVPIRRYFILSVIIILLLILINASVLVFWIWNQRVRSYRMQLLNERSIRESEEKLVESEEIFRKLFENMLNGFAYCKMLYEDGQLPDFIYINVNGAFESLTGLKNVKGKKVSEVIPGIQKVDPELMERYGRVALTGKPEVFEIYMESLKMWFSISVYSPQKEYFVAVFDVITARKLYEEALVLSEERYRNIFNTLIEGFCIIEMIFDTQNRPVDYRFLEVNLAFEKQSGLHDVKGKLMSELVPDNEDYWFEIYGKVALTGEQVQFENEAKALKRWFEVRASRLDGQESRKVIIYFNDITERKLGEILLRESEDKFKYIFDHSVLGKSLTLPSGKLHVNQAFCDMLGYTRDELEKSTWKDISHPDDFEMTQRVIDSLLSGEIGSSRFIKRYLHKNGSVVWTDIGTTLRRDDKGNPLYFMTAVNNISDRIHLEEKLQNLNEELEHRVTQRTEQLQAANKELEAFSYSVSHDLRAPLRAINSYTNILVEEYENKLDEEGKRLCGIISSGAMQMGGLIDDLLSFSKIGRSTLNLSLIDINKMVRTIIKEMLTPDETEKIKIHIGRLQKAYGDIPLFGQVWKNLISNAIKYSSKNVKPAITIGSQIKENTIIYHIKDNGVGFDMQYAHKLFGVFQRLHSESEFEGNGVGLAIVQRIVLKHGGLVWAEGEVGKGAVFHFSLPVQN